MSVIIKGLRMPKTCLECPLTEKSYEDYVCCIVLGYAYQASRDKRWIDCPLEEVSDDE